MSNHARFSPVMANGQVGTAYAPDAEGASEGDRGWPPGQQASHAMGTAYGPAAEGSAEGDILAALNVTSAEVGPRGDDPDLGVSAYDTLRGLREDDADLRMRGLREDDADLRMRGLREDDADLRMRGLREDDSNLRMGRTGAAGGGAEGDSEGSAEGLRVQQMGGILVSNGRVGAHIGVSAYDRMGVSAYDDVMRGMGTTTQYPEELGVSAYDRLGAMQDDPPINPRTGDLGVSAYDDRSLRGLREDDADLRMRGLREDDADLRMRGLREDDAGMRMGVSAYDAIKGLREQDSDLVLLSMRGLREDDAGLRIGSIRTAIMLRGLADAEDMVDEMGRRRASFQRRARRPGHKKFMKGDLEAHDRNVRRYDESMGVSAYDQMGVSAYDQLGAEDFHPRFPVVTIEGLGVMGNIFEDIFGRSMSFEEYIGKLRVMADQWSRIKPRLDRLAPAAQDSIRANMKTAEATYEDYTVNVPIYITEGKAGFDAHSGRAKRLPRWEAYLPTVDKLVSQAEVLGTAYTPAQVKQDAIKDVQQRIDATTKPSFVQEAAPYAAGAVGTGLVVALLTLA